MKFKIAICDDEQNQIDYMASIVASWSAHAGHNCEIRTFASAEAFLFEYEEDKAFGILLLDIEMALNLLNASAKITTVLKSFLLLRILSLSGKVMKWMRFII